MAFWRFVLFALRPTASALGVFDWVDLIRALIALLGISGAGLLGRLLDSWLFTVIAPLLVLVLLLVIAGTRLQGTVQQMQTPLLIVEYDPGDPQCRVKRQLFSKAENGERIPSGIAVDFRVKVRTKGARTIPNVEVMLQRMAPAEVSELPQPLHPLTNPRSLGSRTASSTFNVNPNPTALHYVSVASFRERRNSGGFDRALDLGFQSEMVSKEVPLQNYELVLAVHGQDVPGATRIFRLEWDEKNAALLFYEV